MGKRRKSEKSPSFYKRFNINIDIEEARRRFINRVRNQIFNIFFILNDEIKEQKWWYVRNVANKFGEVWKGDYQDFNDFVGNDFSKCLQSLEIIFSYLEDEEQSKKKYSLSGNLSNFINMILSDSEIDLGLTWKNGKFYPSGAEELDEALVNQPIEWLRDKGYKSVLNPFSKGIEHYLNSGKNPGLLSDVITDLYEALEALAKIITGKSQKDLSANREAFLKKVNATDAYKVILKEYIKYANEFRHAVEEGNPKSAISKREVESFIYLTGIFIRMAMPE
ncbi:hypothetical protein JW926_13775 [Candidatus Sumerlaeota bacterium]|nr:hypothetical protein [Candidatus Sumerlaeota bacterium]